MLASVRMFLGHRIHVATAVAHICYTDLRTNALGQIFPLLPDTLNLLVNDVCNSRCQMCQIWTRKSDSEITPDNLSIILSDRLFSRLRYVGVSGGEPTLRKDLVEIFSAIVAKTPKISGAGIITNAIREDEVIVRVLDSGKVCREAGIPFNVMVSLDGIGDIHDRVRGRTGSYDSAVRVIRYLRDHTDFPVSVGCTITKDNVWNVEQVLDFCKAEGIYGRFRVAEFIYRLYNESQTEFIRNFSEQEKYHLGLFFAKLEYMYEHSSTIKRTYRNIRRMLLEDGERSIRCPYQSTAITLDCRGQLLYCSPRSPVLGSALHDKAYAIYRQNIPKRRDILKSHCGNCIHDYHASETIAEWWSDRTDRIWKERLNLDRALAAAKRTGDAGSCMRFEPSSVLIVGWYGTETAGDKAILAEIIYQLRSRNPKMTIALASLYPFLSRHTLQELGYTDVRVIPSYGQEFWRLSGAVDEVVMGGGPLMHLEQLGMVLWAFIRAKRSGHRCRVLGCGIGPLDRGSRYNDGVREILRLADTVELRDSASVELGRQLSGRGGITNIGDPALGFVLRWKDKNQNAQQKAILSLYLREWTTEYQGGISDSEFQTVKQQFEYQLGCGIHNLCGQLNLRPRLVAMHHFCIGNDDREFNRRFASTHLSDLEPIVEERPLPLHDILQSMVEARLSICMRFHSVLFASALGVHYVAIDYTNGGKIAGFLSDRGEVDKMLTVQEIAAGQWNATS